jgi:acyl-CoA thioesterase
VILLDTMSWPAAHRPHVGNPSFIAPSIDLAVHFHRAAPSAEWLLCDTHAEIAEGGLMGCRSQVWSSDGLQLASGTCQLLCRPVGP